jgi:hypothetical protein
VAFSKSVNKHPVWPAWGPINHSIPIIIIRAPVNLVWPEFGEPEAFIAFAMAGEVECVFLRLNLFRTACI